MRFCSFSSKCVLLPSCDFILIGLIFSGVAFAYSQLRAEESLDLAPRSKKIALLIGNAKYADELAFGTLSHPEKDVQDMATSLRELGFDVTAKVNKNSAEMAGLVNDFARLSASAAMGLFYFSGHGVQSKGESYLLGINADRRILTDPSNYAVKNYSVNLDDSIALLKLSHIPVTVLVFDSCRQIVATKGGPKGLGRISSETRGTLIAYAAAPGQSALDPPEGEHSLFTDRLLVHLKENADIITIFLRAQNDVATGSNFAQMPWLSFSPGLLGTGFTASLVSPASATKSLAEAQEKGARNLPPSEEDSPLLQERSVKSFLEKHWEDLASANVDGYLADFSDPVEWYQQGPTSLDYIQRQIKAAFKHWDSIERKIAGPLSIIPLSNGGGILVTYPMGFDLSKGGTHIKGTGTDIVEVRAIDKRLKIFAQDQQIKSD